MPLWLALPLQLPLADVDDGGEEGGSGADTATVGGLPTRAASYKLQVQATPSCYSFELHVIRMRSYPARRKPLVW